jgi:uncharacterized protein
LPSIEKVKEWYAANETAHDFSHVERVLRLAERIGQSEGADMEIVRVAALLHDVKRDPQGEKSARGHQIQSADFAGEMLTAEGWLADRVQAVQHAIRAHRFRETGEPPQTLEAKVVFDADKLDAIGAVGVARAIAHSASHGLPFYCEPSHTFLKTGKVEPGEIHSAYHEYLFKLVKLRDQLFTLTALGMAAERHAFMGVYFQRLAAEVRAEK